jgi:hypothetical protein
MNTKPKSDGGLQKGIEVRRTILIVAKNLRTIVPSLH